MNNAHKKRVASDGRAGISVGRAGISAVTPMPHRLVSPNQFTAGDQLP